MNNITKWIVMAVLSLLTNFSSFGQIEDPVEWTFNVQPVKAEEGLYDVIATATIEAKWHVYALKVSEDPNAIGPIPTSLKVGDLKVLKDAKGRSRDTLVVSKVFQTIGGSKEGSKYITHFDPNFEMDLNYFENKATFIQRVKRLSDEAITVHGVLEYMACDDSKCIFPDPVKFKLNIPAAAEGTMNIEELQDTVPMLSGDTLQSSSVQEENPANFKFQYLIPSIDLKQPVNASCGEVTTTTTEGASLWELFILGFLGGLLALLTPCVFPMIPLTVTFFTKGSQTRGQGIRRAIVYGLFIFGIYVLLSLPFHFLDQIDENILNNISTNVPLNIAFFVIFVVFAISFFGYFEITLPSSFANKMDNASNVGGLIGTFFMALTLAIVSFSCTGPILGSLLAGSLAKDGGAIQLTAGMGGFGLALGIPFAIFAMFPGMLKSLPKSGGWLNSVKVVLGFAELALALKFLSQADLVDHWGILKYEVFMGLWVIIFILMALYIFGKIKFPHDSPLKKLSLFRIGFGVLIVAWVIYLASGFRVDEKYNTYRSLKALSGLAPPVGYSILYPKDCPHNLDCEHDYALALERSKKEGKPLFIDFTGYACVNCRKMEEHVWIKPEILELLANDFIVVSLYVDDRKELPVELQETYTYEANGKKKTKEIKTYGDRWAAFEIATFNSNAQPLYAIISPDEKLMNTPVGYTPESEEYRAWLLCGLEAFEKSK